MNTTRSEQMAQEFLARKQPFKRKVQTYQKHHSVGAEAVFKQLCPTREADWLVGWVADLIYTDSGYAEPDCVLSTPKDNVLGAGLWIVTRRESNRLFEFVVIRDDGIVGHFTIEVEDNTGGTCESYWRIVLTATTEEANALIEAMPDKDPGFQTVVLDGLEHFLATGERMKLAS